ncbi:iron ABC transporter permease, partial [Clostridioides difficile]
LLANITREIFKTYKHTYLISGSMLIGMITLIIGQFFIQHVFKFDTTLSVVINFIGGILLYSITIKGGK